FHSALRLGGRARSETEIGAGALSIAPAALRLPSPRDPDPSTPTRLVPGGRAARLEAARHPEAEGGRRPGLLNPAGERAWQAAQELGAESGGLEDLAALLPAADAVVAAARVERPLVEMAMLRERRRPLALVDLSLPRAIDPRCAEIPGVTVHNLSDLE